MLKFIIPILLLLLAAVYFFYTQKPLTLPRPRDPRVAAPSISPPEEVVASGLEIPWDIVFLPANTGALMTERPGRVRFLKPDWTLAPDPVLALSDVVMEGEGGLLGIALHPSFPNPPQVYLYYTYRSSGGLKNQVARFTYSADTLTQQTPVITDIPADSNHNGGRLAFSPDGFLYITTGDAGDPQSAQDTSSLSGKILRLNPDGSIPADNPFSNPVWSYGHRNPQGLAWDDQGRLWSVEHGASATDELNLITKGANYGWPDVRGKDTGPGITSPVLQSAPLPGLLPISSSTAPSFTSPACAVRLFIRLIPIIPLSLLPTFGGVSAVSVPSLSVPTILSLSPLPTATAVVPPAATMTASST